MRGNRKLQSTLLDEIDDPHGDYVRAGAAGYDRSPEYPWTLEDVRRHEAEVKGLESWNANLERASSSSIPRQGSSSSAPPAESNKHGVKTLKPRKSRKRKNLREIEETEARQSEAESLVPKFEVGEKVKFESEDGKEWLHGTISQWIPPGDPRNPLDHPHVVWMYLIRHQDEFGRIYLSQIEEGMISHLIDQNLHEGKPTSSKMTLVVRISLANAFHDLDLVGIDTCSAISVSIEKDDFIFVDNSRDARDSVTLRGVGGSSSVIGGRGPMVVKTKDKEGDEVLMFDPSAVYLDPDELDDTQARFRIFGQARLKRAGLKIVQDKYGDDEDYLVYRNGEMEIPMETNDDIVTVRTMPLDLTTEQDLKLGAYIEEVIGGSKEEHAFIKMVHCNSFIMNEANLSLEERARLAHWHQAHRQCGDGIVRENCPICEEGKRKTKGFKRNEEYRDAVIQSFPPYH